MNSAPDYSAYSYQELIDVVNSIDQLAYPERYAEVKRYIEHFESTGKDQDDSNALNITGTEHQLEFNGQANEFFSIWIVNVLLSIITLGIYSAWAKVRTETYFYSNTLLDGASFRYHAKPVQILKGRIIAFTIFSIYYFSGYYSTMLTGITIAILALLMPAFIVMSVAFRLRNSSYRNVRFNFNKNFKKAYTIFLLPFLFMAIYIYVAIQFQSEFKPGSEYVTSDLMPLFVMPLIIGFMFPVFEYFLVKFRINHSSFGRSFFEFDSTVGSFFRIYFVAGVIFFLGIILTTMIISALSSYLFSVVSSSETDPFYVLLTTLLPMMAIYLWVFAYIQTRKTNLIINSSKIQEHQLRSKLEVGKMAYLYFTNTFAIAFSLGLLTPWAMVRTKHYKTSCTSLISLTSLNNIIAAEREDQSAYGEEIGEMFDLDLGL